MPLSIKVFITEAEASLSFDKSDTLTGFLVFAEIENKEREFAIT